MAKTTWSSKLYSYYDEHPEAGPKEAAEAIGCNKGTASGAKDRWKRARGYRIGTVHHPVWGLIKEVSVEEGVPVEGPKEAPYIPKEAIQVRAIADELLKRALEAIQSYDNILVERNSWKKEAHAIEAKAKEILEEKNRVTKAYNEMVQRVNQGQLPTLDEIVHVLRRDLKPGEKL